MDSGEIKQRTERTLRGPYVCLLCLEGSHRRCEYIKLLFNKTGTFSLRCCIRYLTFIQAYILFKSCPLLCKASNYIELDFN